MAAERGSPSFGRLLRQYRIAVGLTQQALADRAGLSRRGIDDLERGVRRTPYRDTVQRLVAALGLSSMDAAELEAAIIRARRQPAAPPSALGVVPSDITCRIPTPLTSFVGREQEVDELGTLLRRAGVRLVTVIGVAGVGKTRLATHVSAAARDAFPDGMWYVRLSRITDPDLVVPAIAQALDLKASGAAPLVDVLQRYLRARRALLVLDNFEHVVAAGCVVVSLLEQCPSMKALVTSRVALHVSGEHEYTLRPLAVPDLKHLPPSHQLTECAAVRLFVERAQAVQMDFAVTPTNAPAIGAVCERLDGLPLAIELAAARIKLLPAPDLLKRLERSLPLLAGGPRNVDERQRTMRNTLAWSFDLLAPEEQRLIRRLAVFVGGCTLEAAEEVCVAPEGVEPLEIELLEGLTALVDQSLVQRQEEESDGETRFGMLYVIREFALEQLEASGEADALRRAHARYYERQADEWRKHLYAQPIEARPPLFQLRHRWLEYELENLRAVLRWAVNNGDRQLGLIVARSLMSYWMRRGLYSEGRYWLEALLITPTSANLNAGTPTSNDVPSPILEHEAVGYYFAGSLAAEQGGDVNLARAATLLEEGIRRLRALGELKMAAGAITNLGNVLASQGMLAEAELAVEESLTLATQVGLTGALQISLLAEYAYLRGDMARALALSEDALLRAAGVGESKPSMVRVNALTVLARAALRCGDATEALAHARTAIQVALDHSSIGQLHWVLEVVAMALSRMGQALRAARLHGAAHAWREQAGTALDKSLEREIEATIQEICGSTGEGVYQNAFISGQALSLEEAIAEALARDDAEQREAANALLGATTIGAPLYQ